MGKSKIVKNMIRIAISNSTSIIAGVLAGFIIPKIMPIEDYGYYKTFTLYITYAGFLCLGIIDGIVLKHGHEDLDELDKKTFRTYFKWYLLVHTIFALMIGISSLFFNDSNIRFIVVSLAIDLLAVNFIGYYQQISQITQRFKEYSFRQIIQSSLSIFTILLLLAMHLLGNEISYSYYVGALVCMNIVLMAWYMFTYKEISFGESYKLVETKSEISNLIKIGLPLLVANIISTLILNFDRQFVNLLFDKNTYAVYAFAYNMLSLVTVATSAISTVLYPTLKRTTGDTMKDNYSRLVSIMLLIVFLGMSCYYPLAIFIRWFLPNYSSAITIFMVIFPGLAITSTVTVIMHNYYKVLGLNYQYFKKCLLILLFSVVANAIAFALFKTTISISIASIITMLIWYVLAEQLFVCRYQYKRMYNLLYLLFMMGAFYIISSLVNEVLGVIIYIVVYLIISLVLQKNTLKYLYEKRKKNI